MAQTDPNKPLCPRCNVRNAANYPGNLCRACYNEKRLTSIKVGAAVPDDLREKIKAAQTSGDWKTLADSLSGEVKDIASGKTKATAAQAAMLKHILDRAYGRVSKSQEDKTGAIGIVILPTIGRDNSEDLRVCPTCQKQHLEHV